MHIVSLLMRVAGYELRVTGCELRVTGCELRVTSCGLRVASCELRVTSYGLRGDNQTNPQSQIEGFCPLSSVLSHLTSVTGYELLVADTNYRPR